MTIGERIKELRKKNHLTQEQLAAYLTVSFQAVSKWETGTACPDLSMIGPLTKLFHISADELLGITDSKEHDARREELKRCYERTFQTEDFAERQRICETAVNEYPGDMKWLCNLAWVISNRSFEHEDNERYAAEQEKAIKLFDSVIRNCGDEILRSNAIEGITQLLSWRGRVDEAKEYVMMLPENKGTTREHVMEYLLTGEELIRFKQERIWHHMEGIIWDLSLLYPGCFSDTIEKLINVMLPDGNLIEMNHPLFFAKQKAVRKIMSEPEYDTAQVIKLLRETASVAAEYDKVAFDKPGVYKYTSPIFDRMETDTRNWFGSEGSTMTEDLKEFMAEPMFDAIRDDGEFQKILKT